MTAEERVLAVPTSTLFQPGYFQGVQPGGAAWLQVLFDPRRSRFIPRAAAESDPAWKQVIPYVVLHCGDAVFRYRRGRGSGELRLRAWHSIGLGGHIRQEDESLFSAPGWAAYRAGLERELAEEVGLEAAGVRADRLVGLINDDAVEVGRVHIGLVHIRTLERPRVTCRETQIAAGGFVPIERLRAETSTALESWSQLCLTHWEALVGQPGWMPEA